MKKIKCLLADDEQLAREVIENYIQRIDSLQLDSVCTNGMEVYNILKKQQFDLLFLDVQMPQLTGIELLRTLDNPPPVILTTAHREFALEGYQLNVIDYLLKPVSFESFLKALDKYERLFNHPEKRIQAAEAPLITKSEGFFYVRSDKKMVRIMLEELLYIEGLKDYVKIHTSSATVITYQTLSYFEEKLSADRFLRIHRSFIVAIDQIEAFSASTVEISNREIPIGQTYAASVLKKLGS